MIGRIYVGYTKHCYIVNTQASGLVVSEKKFFTCYSYHKPWADNDAPWAWPIWTPGAWLAGFIKGITKHCYSSGPHGFREDFLCSFYSAYLRRW